ncbi:MAG: hypothetical protein Q9223_007920, partial [Gallowayella weberi]
MYDDWDTTIKEIQDWKETRTCPFWTHEELVLRPQLAISDTSHEVEQREDSDAALGVSSTDSIEDSSSERDPSEKELDEDDDYADLATKVVIFKDTMRSIMGIVS